MAKQSFAEQVFNGIGDALADVREKAVEEPWFGRAVTERGEPLAWPQAEQHQQPEAMHGEILSPGPEPSPDASAQMRLEHGTVIEGQASQPGTEEQGQLEHWPEARSWQSAEQNRDPSQEQDMER
ncbi:MAG TPA: hypothetical protein VFB14_24115 [Bryobacteraceae bacterium]|jgi:hypothetical protein|nr:hypothetical protein [Bryobacteraceae bacterium]